MNKPSPEWDTTDLAGSAVSLAGCRGKVLVLDFWYRGCGWCIRAMPQMKQVATHFQGRPVAVLGMNTDRDQADAQFVVDKLALNYPTLKAEGLPEKYGVRGFPTLLVIDQAGVVRRRSYRLLSCAGQKSHCIRGKATGWHSCRRCSTIEFALLVCRSLAGIQPTCSISKSNLSVKLTASSGCGCQRKTWLANGRRAIGTTCSGRNRLQLTPKSNCFRTFQRIALFAARKAVIF